MNSSREIRFRMWNTKTRCMYADTGLTSLGLNDAIKLALENNYILEQFTGLRDVNSKKVFEGDILRIKCEGVWQAALYEVTDLQIFYADTVTNDSYVRISGYEVVGNVHENPNLLEAT